MGLSLTIYPLRHHHSFTQGSVLAVDRLTFKDDNSLFTLLQQSNVLKPLPPALLVKLYDEEGSQETREDAYGNILTYAFAQELKQLIDSAKELDSWNQAVLVFLNTLPPTYPSSSTGAS